MTTPDLTDAVTDLAPGALSDLLTADAESGHGSGVAQAVTALETAAAGMGPAADAAGGLLDALGNLFGALFGGLKS